MQTCSMSEEQVTAATEEMFSQDGDEFDGQTSEATGSVIPDSDAESEVYSRRFQWTASEKAVDKESQRQLHQQLHDELDAYLKREEAKMAEARRKASKIGTLRAMIREDQFRKPQSKTSTTDTKTKRSKSSKPLKSDEDVKNQDHHQPLSQANILSDHRIERSMRVSGQRKKIRRRRGSRVNVAG